MDKLQSLIDKKKKEGKTLSPMDAAARHSVLGGLMGELDGEDAKKVKGLKKVTVASDDKNGLEKGLDTAKKLVAHEGEMKDDSDEDEYDDQDAEGPNHMPTEQEASSFGAQDPKLGSPETDENSDLENHEINDEDKFTQLHAENDALKKEIERLKAPKPFY